jgi:hypothetical protein
MKVINLDPSYADKNQFCEYITKYKHMFELFKHFDETQFNDLEINAFNCSSLDIYSILEEKVINYKKSNHPSFIYCYADINIYNILNFCDFYQLNFECLIKFIHQIQELILIYNIIIDKTKLNENMYNLICSNECYINGCISCCQVYIAYADEDTSPSHAILQFNHIACKTTHRDHCLDYTYYKEDNIKGFLLGQEIKKHKIEIKDQQSFIKGLESALDAEYVHCIGMC